MFKNDLLNLVKIAKNDNSAKAKGFSYNISMLFVRFHSTSKSLMYMFGVSNLLSG